MNVMQQLILHLHDTLALSHNTNKLQLYLVIIIIKRKYYYIYTSISFQVILMRILRIMRIVNITLARNERYKIYLYVVHCTMYNIYHPSNLIRVSFNSGELKSKDPYKVFRFSQNFTVRENVKYKTRLSIGLLWQQTINTIPNLQSYSILVVFYPCTYNLFYH